MNFFICKHTIFKWYVYDFLLAPCNKETVEIIHHYSEDHPNCPDNLSKNLEPMGYNKMISQQRLQFAVMK